MSAATTGPTPRTSADRRHRRRRWVALVGGALLVAATVTSLPGVRRGLLDPAGRAPVTGVTTVQVTDDPWEYFAFRPAVVEVPVGTTVRWASDSRAPHDVVLDDGTASPRFAADGGWSHTFSAPGEHRYQCTLHEGMAGRVLVTP